MSAISVRAVFNVDEAHLPVVGELPQLPALALAGRRRSACWRRRCPSRDQDWRDMRRSGWHATRRSMNGLRCSPIAFRHFCRSITSKRKKRSARSSPITSRHASTETFRARPSGEIFGQQRCIVVAKLRAEPCSAVEAGPVVSIASCRMKRISPSASRPDHDRGNGSARAPMWRCQFASQSND